MVKAVIIGLLLIAVGLFLILYLRKKLGNTALEIQVMKTSTIKDIKRIFSEMEGIGLSDNNRHYVELKGITDSQNPPNTPFSEQRVAYHESTLTHVYEEVEYYTDDQGNSHERINKHENIISDERSTEPILLREANSGDVVYIDVDEARSKLDTRKSFDRLERESNMMNYSFFRSFNYGIRQPRTIGFRMVEKTIALNQPLYVLGEAYTSAGRIYIGKPTDKKKPFIISTKSESELVSSVKMKTQFALFGGIGLICLGVAAMILIR